MPETPDGLRFSARLHEGEYVGSEEAAEAAALPGYHQPYPAVRAGLRGSKTQRSEDARAAQPRLSRCMGRSFVLAWDLTMGRVRARDRQAPTARSMTAVLGVPS